MTRPHHHSGKIIPFHELIESLCVDDGIQAGYDLEFTKAISDVVDVPVVASDGAGKLEHFHEAVVRGGARILLAASVFHYRILRIAEVKEYLRAKGLPVSV